MPGSSRLGIGGWIAVVGILLLVDVYTRTSFVPSFVVPRFAPAGLRLQDRTAGHNLGILFEMTRRKITSGRKTVVLVGDSTVSLGVEPEPERLATILERALRQHPGLEDVDVVEFSSLGLPLPEASVLIAKAIALHANLVVYAMTPRIACALDQAATDAAHYVLDWGVASRLGPAFLFASFSPAELAESAVHSRWQLMIFRNEINATIIRTTALYAPALATWLDLKP